MKEACGLHFLCMFFISVVTVINISSLVRKISGYLGRLTKPTTSFGQHSAVCYRNGVETDSDSSLTLSYTRVFSNSRSYLEQK